MIAEEGVDMGSVYNNFNCIIITKMYSVTLFFIFFLFSNLFLQWLDLR